MRHVFLILALLCLLPGAASALDQSAVPPKFPIPWGSSAGSAYIRSIPTPSQIGVQNGAASLTDGFPPLTFVPQSAGGVPPFGQDFNGILKQLSQWSQWAGAGAFPLYDAAFSSSIGGYPSGGTVAQAATPGCFWISMVDNNASDPDTGGSNWTGWCPVNVAYLNKTDQTLSGGANVTSYNLGTGASTVTVDCGKGPLQYITNNASFTIGAPVNDGSCIVRLGNGATAGALGFSGFSVGSNTGDNYTTASGAYFFISIVRIVGLSTYVIKALQ
jgi:hypothetical protein